MDDTQIREAVSYLNDNAQGFALEFANKMSGLLDGSYPLSEKQIALLGKLVRETQNPDAPPETTGEHLGKVGEKLTDLPLTLQQVREINTRMGPSNLHKFSDERGNEVVCFDNNVLATEGEKLLVTGTVSRHSEFRGQRSTTLSRVKFSAQALADNAEASYAPVQEDAPF